MSRRLTNPQRLLLYMIRKEPEHCVESYPPARKLIELGLAERNEWGKLSVTQAGRDWKEDK